VGSIIKICLCINTAGPKKMATVKKILTKTDEGLPGGVDWKNSPPLESAWGEKEEGIKEVKKLRKVPPTGDTHMNKERGGGLQHCGRGG